MKTTLMIPDPVMKQLREEAARQGRTISDLVEEALRGFLERDTGNRDDIPPLPSFDGGRAHVDVANRGALYDVMEED